MWLAIMSCAFAGAIFAAVAYYNLFESMTFAYPPENVKREYVAGRQLTPEADAYRKTHSSTNDAELLADFGGLKYRERVWTREAIGHAKLLLTVSYTALIVGLLVAVFCLVVLGGANPVPMSLGTSTHSTVRTPAA